MVPATPTRRCARAAPRANEKTAGHFNYFAVSTNGKQVWRLLYWVTRIWRKRLTRRRQCSRLTWARFHPVDGTCTFATAAEAEAPAVGYMRRLRGGAGWWKSPAATRHWLRRGAAKVRESSSRFVATPAIDPRCGIRSTPRKRVQRRSLIVSPSPARLRLRLLLLLLLLLLPKKEGVGRQSGVMVWTGAARCQSRSTPSPPQPSKRLWSAHAGT